MNPYYDPHILTETGSKMLSLISSTLSSLSTRAIDSQIAPGFFSSQCPVDPPTEGMPLNDLLKVVENSILPGVNFEGHPMNFADMTGQISQNTIMSEIFINAFHTPGFSWEASPAQTELENIVMDWMAEMLGLPERFFIRSEGGGALSTTTTHSYFHSINVAKYKKMEELNIDFLDPKTLKFVAYFPSTNRKKALKALKMKEIIEIREIPLVYDQTKRNYQMDTVFLEKTIESDLENCLVPFWCDSSFGSEGVCNIDDIEEIGKLCQKHRLALNINANWGGFFLSLDEFKEKYGKTLDYADFILFNGRYLMVGGYCHMMYFSSKELFRKSIGGLMGYPMVDLNLKKKHVMHMKDFSIGFGKRFNSYKLYFTIRRLGASGIRCYLEKKRDLGNLFEANLRKINGIEVKQGNSFGVVCFRGLFDDLNKGNKKLLQEISKESQSGLIGSVEVGEEFILRVSINNESTEEEHVLKAFSKIAEVYEILKSQSFNL